MKSIFPATLLLVAACASDEVSVQDIAKPIQYDRNLEDSSLDSLIKDMEEVCHIVSPLIGTNSWVSNSPEVQNDIVKAVKSVPVIGPKLSPAFIKSGLVVVEKAVSVCDSMLERRALAGTGDLEDILENVLSVVDEAIKWYMAHVYPIVNTLHRTHLEMFLPQVAERLGEVFFHNNSAKVGALEDVTENILLALYEVNPIVFSVRKELINGPRAIKGLKRIVADVKRLVAAINPAHLRALSTTCDVIDNVLPGLVSTLRLILKSMPKYEKLADLLPLVVDLAKMLFDCSDRRQLSAISTVEDILKKVVQFIASAERAVAEVQKVLKPIGGINAALKDAVKLVSVLAPKYEPLMKAIQSLILDLIHELSPLKKTCVGLSNLLNHGPLLVKYVQAIAVDIKILV